MMPIVDFVKIAEELYQEANKNITKNNNPDLFDKYSGTYSFIEHHLEKYYLITYKDTGILHSMFPDKKKHNRKSRTKFALGEVSTSLIFPEGINDLIIPYEDSNKIVRYSILFRKYYEYKTECLFILKHGENGVPLEYFLIGSRDFDSFEKFSMEDVISFQNYDLSDFLNR
jgi:hypothetical protein